MYIFIYIYIYTHIHTHTYTYTHTNSYFIIPRNWYYSYLSFTNEESETQGACPKPRASKRQTWDKNSSLTPKVMLNSKDTVLVQEQTLVVQRFQLAIMGNLLQQFVLASVSLFQRLRCCLPYLPLVGNGDSNPPPLLCLGFLRGKCVMWIHCATIQKQIPLP